MTKEGSEKDEKVYELIDPLNGWWDVAKVKALFKISIATEILRIGIMPNDQVDILVWVLEKDGCFNVKSAYKLITTVQSQTMGECSNSNQP